MVNHRSLKLGWIAPLVSKLRQGLNSPWSSAVAIAVGVTLGLLHVEWLHILTAFAGVIFKLLKMWALPIMFISLAISMMKFVSRPNVDSHLKNTFLFLLVGALVLGATVFTIGSLYNPGIGLSDGALSRLGQLVLDAQGTNDLELTLRTRSSIIPETPLLTFLTTFIPENIFFAFTQGFATQVVVFALLFGTAVGLIQRRRGGRVQLLLETSFAAMRTFTGGLAILAPITLAISIASKVDRSGWMGILAMSKFIAAILPLFFVSYLASIAIVWQQSRQSLTTVLSSFKTSTLFVLSSQEAIPAIPFTITAMEDKLKLDRETVDLVIPLSVTLCRFGSIAYFTMVAIFVAGLYRVSLGPLDMAIVLLGSVLTSVGTATASGGPAMLALFLPVMALLQLPLEAALIPLATVDILLKPFRELSTLYLGTAVAATIADRKHSTTPNIDTQKDGLAPAN
ncbi:MAG: cation:dicarboxylase symporter family transporter [Cyanobacteria bacterium P01_E01_bin.45]